MLFLLVVPPDNANQEDDNHRQDDDSQHYSHTQTNLLLALAITNSFPFDLDWREKKYGLFISHQSPLLVCVVNFMLQEYIIYVCIPSLPTFIFRDLELIPWSLKAVTSTL